jgi:hypothetical protein
MVLDADEQGSEQARIPLEQADAALPSGVTAEGGCKAFCGR